MKVLVTLFALLAISHIAAASDFATARADIFALAASEVNFGPSSNNYVLFTAINETHVEVAVTISGIVNNPDGLHGMHIHTFGDLSSAAALGSHWNPFNVPHGCGNTRSAGDLGNWQASGGTIEETKILDLIALNGTNSIIGRGVVLHNSTDDCASVASSGARLAAGVIGIANDATGNPAAAAPGSGPFLAVCKLTPTPGGETAGIHGSFYWVQSGAGASTQAFGSIGINGTYGVHVHQFGDLSDRATAGATGGHFDPLATGHHDFPNASVPHHEGDMGNTDETNIRESLMWYHNEFTYMTIAQTASFESIIGRGFIVHSTYDHGTQPTGAAGSRNAQCVIGIANVTGSAVPLYPANGPTAPSTPSAPTGSASALAASAILFALALIATLL